MAPENTTTETLSENPGTAREYKEIFGAVERGGRSYWTRIGVAFMNRDGSLNLRFDFLPTDASTTIQVRDPRERTAAE